MEKILIDVRTREEYMLNHIKGALNVPLYDLSFYLEFMKDKEVVVYCDTGERSELAVEELKKHNVAASVLAPEKVKAEKKEGYQDAVCAVNYVEVREGYEETFEEAITGLCLMTNKIEGFLGSKVFKISGISAAGIGLPGDLSNTEIKPCRYIILTYWESKEMHEKSHRHEIFVEAFGKMASYISKMPYEEFYEILH